MKKLVLPGILFLSLTGQAHGGANPSDDRFIFLYIAGFLFMILALLELPRWINRARMRMAERRRLKEEQREADAHSEENHYFAGA
jgi:hypothetical protein